MSAPLTAPGRRPFRSPLRERDFRLMLLGTCAAFTGYALLLSVVPSWAVRQGAGAFAAGAATGVFMGSTVLAQLVVPALVRAYGYRTVLLLGASLLGLPAPLLILAVDAPWILAISLLRGLGFGLLTVCGSALIAELLPADALARGSGLYGLATGVPQLAGLPLGTLVASHWGFPPVFLLAAVLPLAAIVPFLLLPGLVPGREERTRIVSTVDVTWRPWLVMIGGSIGFGAFVTFLPIVLPAHAALALLAVTATVLLARWAAGHAGDRFAAPGRMLPFALALIALGLVVFALGTRQPVAAILAVAVFGIGFGVVQNDSLVAMFVRAPAGQASVVWNVAYDAGQGLGAVAVGAAVAGIGYPGAFGLLAGVAVVLLPVAWRAGRSR
ncbi:MFS transporter [Amycolatopsis antarctica]|uniref:MFS transporter n=1 Tax=Amycolatopsis antarctica TaxID=1854586 RepID=A0A263CWL3_9PSEU|nr:MFS transporter [Amycolatopsis antarctica]OZM70481.1 MFS transporter [Amycolatopsis antarctica]